MTSPFDLKNRTLRPSSSWRKPTRSALRVCGLKIATFEACSGISFSMIPPVIPRIGLGRWCFLTLFAPSTMRWSSSSTRRIAPRLPLSRPVVTITSSPFFSLRMASDL
jgi:hypothetical protein